MNIPLMRSLILLFVAFTVRSYAGQAATPLAKVVMTTGSYSEREGAVYVAQDQGFLRGQ